MPNEHRTSAPLVRTTQGISPEAQALIRASRGIRQSSNLTIGLGGLALLGAAAFTSVASRDKGPAATMDSVEVRCPGRPTLPFKNASVVDVTRDGRNLDIRQAGTNVTLKYAVTDDPNSCKIECARRTNTGGPLVTVPCLGK
jgi:hypothetical protein